MFEDASEYMHDVRTMIPATEQEALIYAHLPFVISLAKRYVGHGLSLLDLIQEGNIGLLRAATRYDPSEGKFITYAAFWVKQSITRALADKSRLIRAPVYLTETISRYKKLLHQYEQNRLPHPSDEVIQQELDISPETLMTLRFLMSTEDIEGLYWSSDEEEERYGLEDSQPTPEEAFSQQETYENVQVLLSVLTPEERTIVYLAYVERWNYPQIRAHTGRTPETIKRILARALLKMRGTAHRLRITA